MSMIFLTECNIHIIFKDGTKLYYSVFYMFRLFLNFFWLFAVYLFSFYDLWH